MIVPGVTKPHDVALDDRLCSSLLRLRRVFDLLADRDAMAERDEAVEIIVGALDRHAAHADVFALMLAPFGEDYAERPARDLRVVEEELIEIAHPVKQQAVGIGRLDLEILRHHRREARSGDFGIGAVAGGVHRLKTSKSAPGAQGRGRVISTADERSLRTGCVTPPSPSPRRRAAPSSPWRPSCSLRRRRQRNGRGRVR